MPCRKEDVHMAEKILVADDGRLLVNRLRASLEQEGYTVFCSYNGQQAVQLAQQQQPDLVLLDMTMPVTDGMEACMKIRSFSDVPVLVLTARNSEADRLMSFSYGADDYMTKPFSILELKARIRALLRRNAGTPEQREEGRILRCGSVLLDTHRRTVEHDNHPVELTAREFELLTLFMRNPGRVFSRTMLLDKVWGEEYQGDDRTVDVHIRRIREKLEKEPSRPQVLRTKWGVGYYLDA